MLQTHWRLLVGGTSYYFPPAIDIFPYNVRKWKAGSVIAVYLQAPWGCVGGSVWSVRSSCRRGSDCHVMALNWAWDGLILFSVSHRQQSIVTLPHPAIRQSKERFHAQIFQPKTQVDSYLKK